MLELRILCIHGVGRHPVGGDWQTRWRTALQTSLDRLDHDAGLDVEFFHHDAIFDTAAGGAGDMLDAIGKLGIGEAAPGFDAPRAKTRAARALTGAQGWTASRIVQWAENAALRDSLSLALAEAIRHTDPQIIFAHSIGGLIAYDAFRHQANPGLCHGRMFVSLGTQLGNAYIRSHFAGRIQPLESGYWYDLHNVHDGLYTPPLRLSEPNFEDVETPFDASADPDHTATGYLSHPNVSVSVWADALATPAQGRKVRAVRRAARHGGAHGRRALIVGIDAYPDPGMRLEGCVNDAFLMSEILQENGFEASNIRLLLNERATAEAIWARLEWLLQGTGARHERVLYFAGHGAQIPDYGADETIDRVDECLVPVDFDWTRERAITDDRFHALYSQLPYDSKFMAIFDCCHSGGMTRSGGRPRGISAPDDIRHRSMIWNAKTKTWSRRALPIGNTALTANEKGRRIGYFGSNQQRRLGRATDLLTTLDNRSFNRIRDRLDHHGPYLPVILQACQEDELANEFRHGNVSHGAFTYAFAQVMREAAAGEPPELVRLEQLVQHRVRQLVNNQRPQIVAPGPRYSEPLFSTSGP